MSGNKQKQTEEKYLLEVNNLKEYFPLGRTYYVSETDVTGKAIDSGMTPDEKVYVPVYPQGQAITVTEDGAKSSITFENQFSEWPDGFYKIATMNVTKKLLGADGNALESDEIFYAGIFDYGKGLWQ